MEEKTEVKVKRKRAPGLKTKKYPWLVIEKEYIAGIYNQDTKQIEYPSKADLARKWNISAQYLNTMSTRRKWNEKKQELMDSRAVMLSTKVDSVIVEEKLEFNRRIENLAYMELNELYEQEKLRIQAQVALPMNQRKIMVETLLLIKKLMNDKSTEDVVNNNFAFTDKRITKAFDVIYRKVEIIATEKDNKEIENEEIYNVDDVVEGSAEEFEAESV
jgi:hypothetical protein